MNNHEIPNPNAAHHTITKRIRSTNYVVNIFHSTTSKESITDKILRLIKNDIANGALCQIQNPKGETPHE